MWSTVRRTDRQTTEKWHQCVRFYASNRKRQNDPSRLFDLHTHKKKLCFLFLLNWCSNYLIASTITKTHRRGILPASEICLFPPPVNTLVYPKKNTCRIPENLSTNACHVSWKENTVRELGIFRGKNERKQEQVLSWVLFIIRVSCFFFPESILVCMQKRCIDIMACGLQWCTICALRVRWKCVDCIGEEKPGYVSETWEKQLAHISHYAYTGDRTRGTAV